MRLQLIATAAFGLEACVKRELLALGYEIITTENGKVTFWGDERAIVRGNLWLRTADRLYLKMGEFRAESFEELFQQTKGIAWEELIPPDGVFPVIGTSVKSMLHSVPACQSIVKKAIVSRLSEAYGMEQFPESGAKFAVRFSLMKDEVLLMVDTSGDALHKRGYRVSDVAAPIKETLAAAMVQLSFWRPGKTLADLCCGSGTIPIEVCLIGRNIAPGLSRGCVSEKWDLVPREFWKDEKAMAFQAIDRETELRIFARDIDPRAIASARKNAEEAGVGDDIVFQTGDAAEFQPEGEYGVIVTNLPYGMRIGEKDAIQALYRFFRGFLRQEPTWSLFAITSDPGLEKALGKRADRRRKLYNGNIETTYYQFHGKRPERKNDDR